MALRTLSHGIEHQIHQESVEVNRTLSQVLRPSGCEFPLDSDLLLRSLGINGDTVGQVALGSQ